MLALFAILMEKLESGALRHDPEPGAESLPVTAAEEATEEGEQDAS